MHVMEAELLIRPLISGCCYVLWGSLWGVIVPFLDSREAAPVVFLWDCPAWFGRAPLPSAVSVVRLL